MSGRGRSMNQKAAMRVFVWTAALACAIHCLAQPPTTVTVDPSTPVTSIVQLTPSGAHPSWCHYNCTTNHEIVYHKLNTTTGYTQIWSMAKDGSNQICLSCTSYAVSTLPQLNQGNPFWNHAGTKIFFQAQNANSTITASQGQVGGGLDNSLWVCDVNFTTSCSAAISAPSEQTTGLLQWRLTADGSKLFGMLIKTWSGVIGASGVMEVCNWSDSSGVSGCTTYDPIGPGAFYEGATSDPTESPTCHIYWSALTTSTATFHQYSMNLCAGTSAQILASWTQFTRNATEWSEMGDFSPDGSHYLVTSSALTEVAPPSSLASNPTLDATILTRNGLGWFHAVTFNNPSSPELYISGPGYPTISQFASFSADGTQLAVNLNDNHTFNDIYLVTLSTAKLTPTCTITSPSASQIFQSASPVSLSATVAGAPNADRLMWSIDYQTWAEGFAHDPHRQLSDARDPWQGPWTATWFTGLNGDGPHTASGTVYDKYGNVLTACAPVVFTVRVEGMSTQSINKVPTSGTGQLGLLTFDGANANQAPYVDGYQLPYESVCGGSGATSQPGGVLIPTFNTRCFANGPHVITYPYQLQAIQDPYVLSKAFTSSNVSGNNISVPSHYSLQGSVVTFSTTGTLPSPLVAGSQCFWATSSSNTCKVTVAPSASGTLTFTTSTPLGVTAGTPVFVRNIAYTNQVTGQSGCDGYYLASGGSGTSFTLPMLPTCPHGTIIAATNSNPVQLTLSGALPANNDQVSISGFTGAWSALNGTIRLVPVAGSVTEFNAYYQNTAGADSTNWGMLAGSPGFTILSNTSNLEIEVNPYFVQYGDANTISVSATPQGSIVVLSNGGSGTHTLVQRLRSPYWTGNPNFGGQIWGGDLVASGGPANVTQLVTFSNGTSPMEIEVPYWEMHMLAGGAAQSVCPKIKNTDLSLTTLSCSASGLTYTLTPDGGLTGVISVDSSGNVTPLMAGWAQVQVACSSCAAGGVSLRGVTVYIQVHSGSIAFPHFTHGGGIVSAFQSGQSFFPLSTWQMNVINGTTSSNAMLWLGPMMQESNLNSSMISPDPSGSAFGDPSQSSCYSSTWPSAYHQTELAFAQQYNTYFEVDLTSTHASQTYLSALLGNTTYNRQSCLTGFLSSLASEGRTWRSFGLDELNNYIAGNNPFRNPNLGSTGFPSIVVSGGVATYNVGEAFQGVWNASNGSGSWVKIAGAATNTCLNGWFPVSSIQTNTGGFPVSFTTPTTCANGTYTESTVQLYHLYVSGVIDVENAANLPRINGVAGGSHQNWDMQWFTQIVVSGCTTTTCTAEFYMPSHGIVNGQAIRVNSSSYHLNVVAPVTVIDTDHFSITYNSLFGTLPANGTYTYAGGTGTADANLFLTVDGNLPPTPFQSLSNILASVPNHLPRTWPAIGFTYGFSNGVINPGVQGWQGTPSGEDAAWNYIPQGPTPYMGPDASVWQWANYSQPSSGLATRAYQLQPRAMLWSGGYLGGGNVVQYCRSFVFNPGCDRPSYSGLFWRPESTVAQMIGMLTLNIEGLRLYNFAQNMDLLFARTCCGWQTTGTGTGAGMNPMNDPKQWAAMARTNALIKLREDTELQPPTNKPYLGPFFQTDAHQSATYGNELKILCASEMPYGTQSIALPAASGGSMIKYILTGYALSMQVMSGNPSTDTDEFCSSPGRTTTYVALPANPTVQPVDNITFSPPATLPFGALKFLVQVGYYPRAMEDDAVTDCTSACTIAVDHHNTAAWYRVIYADANSIPLSIGDAVRIPAQGLN